MEPEKGVYVRGNQIRREKKDKKGKEKSTSNKPRTLPCAAFRQPLFTLLLSSAIVPPTSTRLPFFECRHETVPSSQCPLAASAAEVFLFSLGGGDFSPT